jgi:PhnB protein
MADKINAVPDGYHSVIPYMIVDGAAAAIDFYTMAFGATEVLRIPGPDGKIGHAELKIGDSHIMLADEHPKMEALGPKTVGGSPIKIMVYLEDVDAVVGRAVAGGAKIIRPVADQFYGDRTGGIEDPFGHIWYVATHIEDVPMDELQKRAAAQGAG